MRNWLSFLLIILFPVSTWAQEMMVQGRVVDAETGEALPYVSIYAGEGKGTLSNDDGDFKLVTDAGSILTFSCIGYEKLVIKTSDIIQTIKLEPYSTSLQELTIQAEPLDVILKRIISNLKKDYRKNSKWTRKYFFRTYTEVGDGNYFAEAFMKVYSVVNIRSAMILSGLEGRDTEGNKGSLDMQNSNIHKLIEVGAAIHDSPFWREAITPLSDYSTSRKCYDIKLQHMKGEDGNKLYRIEFIWKKKVPKWLRGMINITGTAYVDAETCRLLRFDGVCNNCKVYTGVWYGSGQYSHNEMYTNFPTAIMFDMEYDYSEGAASVSHLVVYGGNPFTCYHALLFAIEKNEKESGKMKTGGSNMVTAVRKAGFDAKLWDEYDIVKRTKKEEQAAFGEEVTGN